MQPHPTNLAQAPSSEPAPAEVEPDPVEATVRRCDECDDAAQTDEDLHEVITRVNPRQTRRLCHTCVDDRTWSCARCDRLLLIDGAGVRRHETAIGSEICAYCFDADYFTCEGCERVLHNDDYDSDGYCQRCAGPEEEEEEPADVDEYARAYTGVHASKLRGPFPTLRLSGLELECEQGEAWQLADALPEEVGLHGDGSLDDQTGAEIVTPPASGTELERLIRESCRAAQNAGYETSRACGLHVHVEYPQDEAAVRRLFATVYALEDFLYGLLADSRINNTYCTPLRSSYAFAGPRVRFWRKWYVQKPKDKHKSNETRYHGLNLHSVYYRGTVEFRHHEGTLEAEEAINWVRVCQSLVHYAQKRYRRAELVAELQRPAHRDWDAKLAAVSALLAWPKDLQAWARKRVDERGRRRPAYPKGAAAREMLVRLRQDREEIREERNWAQAHVGLELLAQAVA